MNQIISLQKALITEIAKCYPVTESQVEKIFEEVGRSFDKTLAVLSFRYSGMFRDIFRTSDLVRVLNDI